MSVLRYFLPNGGDILLNFTHIMDFFAEWKAADSENNFLYHLFWFLYYNNQFKMHNNFKQTKIKRTGQSPLNVCRQQTPPLTTSLFRLLRIILMIVCISTVIFFFSFRPVQTEDHQAKFRYQWINRWTNHGWVAHCNLARSMLFSSVPDEVKAASTELCFALCKQCLL